MAAKDTLIFLLIGTVLSEAMVQLPGLFSTTICDGSLVHGLQPLCTCKQRVNVTGIHNLCRSYSQLSECMDKELQKVTNQTYLKMVFDKKKMDTTMKFISELLNELGGKLTTCSRTLKIESEDETFKKELEAMMSKPVQQEDACKITDHLSKTYWNALKDICTVRERHLLSKLAESYITTTCSKFGTSKSDKCANLRKAYHPNSKDNHSECLAAVDTMAKCFVRERLDSHHPYDRWTNIDLVIDRFVKYEKLRCEIKKDLNKECKARYQTQLRHCGNIYRNGYTAQVKMMEDNINVTVEDVCILFHNVTQCIDSLFTECPSDRINFNAMFCRSMPASCRCPLDLKNRNAATTSSSFLSMAFLIIAVLNSVISWII